jgi:hypothetical protein
MIRRRLKNLARPFFRAGIVKPARRVLRFRNDYLKGGTVRFFERDGYHVFFGYYDLCPFNRDETRVLAGAAPAAFQSGGTARPLEIGYFDRRDGAFHRVGETTTWCWQQGCRLAWFPAGENRQAVIYNRMVNGRYGCVVQDPENGETLRTYNRPLYSISPDGRHGISLNFSRLHRFRPGYGYPNLDDPTRGDSAPENDGLFHVDLETGESRLLVSIKRMAGIAPLDTMRNAGHYFNHVCFAPSGDRFLVFHLWQHNGKRHVRMAVFDLDGKVLGLFGEGYVSHYAWKNDREILAFASVGGEKGYYLYSLGSERVERIGTGTLDRDGHPSFLDGGGCILTDTYPDRWRRQHLLLYDPGRRRVRRVAWFFVPREFQKEVRADLHPRPSPSGRYVAVDTVRRGMRVLCLVQLRENAACKGDIS